MSCPVVRMTNLFVPRDGLRDLVRKTRRRLVMLRHAGTRPAPKLANVGALVAAD